MKKTKFCKVVTLREEVNIESDICLDEPRKAYAYIQKRILAAPEFREDQENVYVLILNTRRNITAHFLVSLGLLDQTVVHPREVFRPAIAANASAIILMHNHPSGTVTPSENDIRETKKLIQAGKILQIDLLDHLIVTPTQFCSLREQGYFI